VTATDNCSSAADTNSLPVSDGDDVVNCKPHLHHHHHCVDNASWQGADDVTDDVINSSDIMLTLGSAITHADTTSTGTSAAADTNGTSTLTTADTSGVSPLSAGDSITSDGSCSGFIVAMHRKMVCAQRVLQLSTFTFVLFS